MPDRAESSGGRLSTAIEIGSALVLSLAGLLTAWVGFQSDLWTGVQQARYAQFGVVQQQAAQLQIEAHQLHTVEVSLFTAWLDARASGEAQLSEFYRDRFPINLDRAFEEWVRLGRPEMRGRPSSPFNMPSYQVVDPRAVKAAAQADAIFEEGQKANGIADSFGQGNVMLAMAMFLAGIAQIFRIRPLRVGLLAVSVIACAVGVARVATLPMLHPGG